MVHGKAKAVSLFLVFYRALASVFAVVLAKHTVVAPFNTVEDKWGEYHVQQNFPCLFIILFIYLFTHVLLISCPWP